MRKLNIFLSSIVLCVLSVSFSTVSFAQDAMPVQLASDITSLRKIKRPRLGQSLVVSNVPHLDEKGRPIGYSQTIRTTDFSTLVKQPSRLSLQAPLGDAKSPLQIFQALLPKELIERDVKKDIFPFGGEDPIPQALGCLSNVEVTVLANEITYGAGGPQVPTRVDRVIDTNTQAMFGGANVTVGATDTFQLQPDTDVTFIAMSRFPDFNAQNPVVNFNVANSDPVMAAVLLNGNNFLTIAQAKGIQAIPYGMQQSLEAILGSIVNFNTGLVTLPEDEMIILYELGATSAQSPAFDFNDLVLRVKTTCPNVSEVVIRDSIGDTNALTNGRIIFSTDLESVATQFENLTTFITMPSTITLKRFEAVVAPLTLDYYVNWADFNYTIKVWSSDEATTDSPTQGDVANCSFDFPTNWGSHFPPAIPFGLGESPFGGDMPPTYRAVFDFSNHPDPACRNIVLDGGSEYAFALQPDEITSNVPCIGNCELLGTLDSSDVLLGQGQDWYYYGFLGPLVRIRMIDVYPDQVEHGRAAYKIVGISN